MAEPAPRRGLPPELGVGALVVAASLPLGRLFRTGSVSTVALAAAACSSALAWGLRRLRAPTLLAATGSFLGFLWFACAAFFREAMLGPFPTPRALALVWDAAAEGIRRSQTEAAPVPATASFLLIAAFAVWATAWLADDAAEKLRHPTLAVGVTLPLFVLPGSILEGRHRWLDAALYLATALWVLFADERRRLARWGRAVGGGIPGWRPGLAARMGGVAIALAVVATPALPGVGAPPGLRGSTGRSNRVTVNPLVSIRPQLSDRDVTELFLVRSSEATYWRLTALDQFNGTLWTSGPQRGSYPIGERPIPPQNPGPGIRVTQEVEIRNLGGPWVPVAWEPIEVRGLRRAGIDPGSRTVIAPGDLRYGLRYAVVSRVPRVTFEELDAASVDPAIAAGFLALPRTQATDRVAAITRQILAAAGAAGASPFRQAVAIQDHLRTFTYDEDVALRHDIRDIEAFLTRVRRGYCEQFAAAMAVMLRTVGIPSRVAIGFAVGVPGRTPDEQLVTSRQAHAWVEAHFAGFGWIAFEPTPRTDAVVVPSYTRPPSQPVPAATTSPTPQATATPTASPTPSPRSERFEEPTPPPPAEGDRLWLAWTVGAGSPLLALAAALPGAAWCRRALRRRRARSPAARVTAAYLDFLDWCVSVGLARRPGETPLEHARRLGPDGDGPVLGLASAATAACYAPPDGADPAAARALVRAARQAVARGLPRRARLAAAVGWGWWRSDAGGERRTAVAWRTGQTG